MKFTGKTAGILIIFISILIPITYASEIEEHTPWVYPLSEPNPTNTEYWTVPLHGGYNEIHLVLWNHENTKGFHDGKFIIALKSGLGTFTIDNINLAFDTEDLSGTSTPGHPFPLGGIFPCPWKQYTVGIDLTSWVSPDGWQGPSDTSGKEIIIEITIPEPNSAENIELYFLAWGYDVRGDQTWPSDTPYSHITKTVPVPPFVIPEFPLGTIIPIVSSLSLLGLSGILKKKKISH